MVHDTVINIQADSSSLKALLECNEKGEVILRRLLDYQAGQTAGIPQVKISGNILSANCKCDSAKIHAVLKDRETKVYKRNETVITPPAIEVKYIPGWMWFFGITGMIAWGFILIIIIIKLAKSQFKFGL